MMSNIRLRKPSTSTIRAFLNSQASLGFTYAAVGTTATTPPAGYNVNHSRIKLGEGEQVFISAKSALKNWTQFRLGWVDATSFAPSIQIGQMVAIVGKSVGLWWLNACRVVYLIGDDDAAAAKFGFAYGTLPAHAGTGEERFLVEWDRSTNTVWYDVLAFSKPHGLLPHLGYPWMRAVQRRFSHESGAAIKRAVDEAISSPLAMR